MYAYIYAYIHKDTIKYMTFMYKCTYIYIYTLDGSKKMQNFFPIPLGGEKQASASRLCWDLMLVLPCFVRRVVSEDSEGCI